MADFITKEKDTRNAMAVTLNKNGSPVDLTDKTLCFVIGNKSRTIYEQSPIIQDAANGKILVDFSEEQLIPGRYRGECVVTHEDGTQDTYPNKGYISIAINTNLEGC